MTNRQIVPSFTWEIIERDSITKKTIEQITAEASSSKKFIGTAYGRDIFHCIYLCSRHERNFEERVKYFHINPEKDKVIKRLEEQTGNICIRVDFYEERDQYRDNLEVCWAS